ncbi:MAG: AAA family ATPase [Betaproteobacteria bacterium SG8_39]|nr:MAG: AAA family ATPase [Betaproteobacteria bacterium SG8_39]
MATPTPLSTSIHDIKLLVQSYHPLIVIETVEEERARALLLATAQELRMPLFEWSVTHGLLREGEPPSAQRMTADPAAALPHIRSLTVEAIFLLKDFSAYLKEPAVARHLRELAQRFDKTRSTLVLTGRQVDLPKDVEHLAVHHHLRLPDESELDAAVTEVLRSVQRSLRRTIQIAPEERKKLFAVLRGLTVKQARQAVARVLIDDGVLTAEDLRGLLTHKADAIRASGLLEYYPAEDNRFELGGFARLKAWLERARHGFSEAARSFNLSAPRGVLLVGVPGCGKSLAAKVIAREWGLPLLKLDAARLYDKFIGESEKNFLRATALAESMAPAVLWIDEIEKGLVASGTGDADAGLGRRLFGAFLTWLQEKKQDVFLVATANDLSMLPPELLRKGRFDEIFFVDLPEPDERRQIWDIHLRRHNQDAKSFDLDALVAASDGFSGAEIEQAVVAGLYRALHVSEALSSGALLEELRQTRPLSVTRREDIARLRATARDRFVGVR